MSQVQWKEVDFEKASAAYPEIPSTVLIDIEASRWGVKLTQDALKAIQDMDVVTRNYSPHLSVFGEQETQVVQRFKIPTCFYLRKDENTHLGLKLNSNSPYTIDIRNERFIFTDERLGPTSLEEVYFIPKPKFLSKTLPDGTPYERVIHVVAADLFAFTVNHYCGFWGTGEQCKFCDYGIGLELKRKRGLNVGKVAPRAAAEVIKEAFESEPGYHRLAITGGTILDAEKEVDNYCEYLNAINEAFGGVWYPAHLSIVAREEKYLKRIKETGLPSIHLNMEVWDERLFNIICPGKAQLIGREEWIKRAIKGVDIFGRGNVLITFVTGVEMAQPWGFKDAHSAVKNTLQGFNFLMEHGVLPKLNIWRSEYGSVLGGQASPPLEYYIELFIGFVELAEKHKFVFPGGRNPGEGNSNPGTAIWYYRHKEEPALKPAENASRNSS